VSIKARLLLAACASIASGCTTSDTAPSAPLPTSYQLDVRLAASCPAPVPALMSIPLTRTDDPMHSQKFLQVGRVTGTGTSVFELFIDGAVSPVTGSFGGIAAGTSDLGRVLFSSAGARLNGSGTPSQGYNLTITGSVNYCSEFQSAPNAPDTCARSLSCDATHTATLKPS
jgi:hypothetical protein